MTLYENGKVIGQPSSIKAAKLLIAGRPQLPAAEYIVVNDDGREVYFRSTKYVSPRAKMH